MGERDDPDKLSWYGQDLLEASSRHYPPVLPARWETAAVPWMQLMHVAALAYDRVWTPPFEPGVPDEVRFWGGTPVEVAMSVMALGAIQKDESLRTHSIRLLFGITFNDEDAKKWLYKVLGSKRNDRANVALSSMAAAIAQQWNKNATVVLPSREALNEEYSPGDLRTVVSLLSGAAVPDSSSLTWEQVLELRHDEDSRNSYRRFVHWLDATMVGKSPKFVADEIALKLDDYRRALSKHGVKTVAGVLTRMLDPRWAAYASMAGGGLLAAGQEFWVAVSAFAVIGCSLTVSVADAMIERTNVRHEHGDIAFVHQLAEKGAADK